LRDFRTVFAVLQRRQRHPASAAPSIRFLARQPVNIDLLQLLQRFLR
jgi:hypothetical protein